MSQVTIPSRKRGFPSAVEVRYFRVGTSSVPVGTSSVPVGTSSVPESGLKEDKMFSAKDVVKNVKKIKNMSFSTRQEDPKVFSSHFEKGF